MTVSTVAAFSTNGIPAAERVGLWEEYNARALMELHCRPPENRGLHAVQSNLAAPRIKLAHVLATAHTVERTSSQVEKTPSEGLAVYFSRRGGASFHQNDVSLCQTPGSILVCSVQQPFVRQFPEGVEELVLRLPRELIDETAPEMSRSLTGAARVTSGPVTSSSGRRVSLIVSEMFKSGAERLSIQRERDLMGRLRPIISAEFARSPEGRRQTVTDYIELHLQDPGLSVSRIAHHFGLSDRHVSRQFAATGVGLASTILTARLERALLILQTPASLPQPISEVAVRCGFASHAHFTRAFRDRYACTPLDIVHGGSPQSSTRI